MKCKVCESENLVRWSNLRVICNDCGHTQKGTIPKILKGEKQPLPIKSSILTLLRQPKTIDEISLEINKTPIEVEGCINELIAEKFNIQNVNGYYELSGQLKQGGYQSINLAGYENKIYKIGITSDNHLCSKFERLDVLNAIYDIYESEGITEVYNAGNWIDGEASFNKYDLFVNGMTPQVEYFIKNYPQRKGITTYFIAGDDHEGWYVQREKINIGEYAELKAVKSGRNDLKYLGYVEADVEFKASKGKAIMKVMHPGGGSAYALSYSPQKMVESFSGGEKPQILILGHYHKFDYMHYRNVFTIQSGTTQDQTIFMRKKKLQAHVGGVIFEFQISREGSINRGKVEWLSFYDRDFYKKQGYYR